VAGGCLGIHSSNPFLAAISPPKRPAALPLETSQQDIPTGVPMALIKPRAVQQWDKSGYPIQDCAARWQQLSLPVI